MNAAALRGRRHISNHPWQSLSFGTASCFKTSILLLLVALWISLAVPGSAEVQYLDVITLKDGRSFKGLNIEQTPEGSFRLENLSGSVMSFAAEEIEKALQAPSSVKVADSLAELKKKMGIEG